MGKLVGSVDIECLPPSAVKCTQHHDQSYHSNTMTILVFSRGPRGRVQDLVFLVLDILRYGHGVNLSGERGKLVSNSKSNPKGIYIFLSLFKAVHSTSIDFQYLNYL